MKRMMIFMALVATLSLEKAAAQSTPPAFNTGNDLLPACLNPEPKQANYCEGYIIGVWDTLSANRNPIAGWSGCFPQVVTQGHLKDVVAQWLQRHPEMAQYSAASLVLHAFAEAFPCR